jgi:ankyrin repeat protein
LEGKHLCKRNPDQAGKTKGKRLLEAIDEGDVARVKELIKEGLPEDACDERGLGPLSLAASDNRVEIVQLLLEKGFAWEDYGSDEFECYDEGPTRALVEAVWACCLNVCPVLIKYGADPNKFVDLGIDEEGPSESAFTLAAKGILGEDPMPSWEHEPGVGYCEILKFFLSADCGCEVEVDQTPKGDSRTALAYAAGFGALELVRMLIARGANVDGVSSNKGSPVYFACADGQIEVLDELLKHGASPDVQYNYSTALIAAIDQRHEDIALKLIDAGADVNRTDWKGHNAFDFALLRELPNVVSILSAKGGTPTTSDPL